MKRVCDKQGTDILSKYQKKLKNLYNGDVVLPDEIFNIINLSSHKLTVSKNSTLTKELNFSIEEKVLPINRKYLLKDYSLASNVKKRKATYRLKN